MKFHLATALLLVAALSPAALAQNDTTPKQSDNGGIKQDTKDAAHSTAHAAKKTGHKIKHGTKKAVNKSADATSKGANKVEDKTKPSPTPPPQ